MLFIELFTLEVAHTRWRLFIHTELFTLEVVHTRFF